MSLLLLSEIFIAQGRIQRLSEAWPVNGKIGMDLLKVGQEEVINANDYPGCGSKNVNPLIYKLTNAPADLENRKMDHSLRRRSAGGRRNKTRRRRNKTRPKHSIIKIPNSRTKLWRNKSRTTKPLVPIAIDDRGYKYELSVVCSGLEFAVKKSHVAEVYKRLLKRTEAGTQRPEAPLSSVPQLRKGSTSISQHLSYRSVCPKGHRSNSNPMLRNVDPDESPRVRSFENAPEVTMSYTTQSLSSSVCIHRAATRKSSSSPQISGPTRKENSNLDRLHRQIISSPVLSSAKSSLEKRMTPITKPRYCLTDSNILCMGGKRGLRAKAGRSPRRRKTDVSPCRYRGVSSFVVKKCAGFQYDYKNSEEFLNNGVFMGRENRYRNEDRSKSDRRENAGSRKKPFSHISNRSRSDQNNIPLFPLARKQKKYRIRKGRTHFKRRIESGGRNLSHDYAKRSRYCRYNRKRYCTVNDRSKNVEFPVITSSRQKKIKCLSGKRSSSKKRGSKSGLVLSPDQLKVVQKKRCLNRSEPSQFKKESRRCWSLRSNDMTERQSKCSNRQSSQFMKKRRKHLSQLKKGRTICFRKSHSQCKTKNKGGVSVSPEHFKRKLSRVHSTHSLERNRSCEAIGPKSNHFKGKHSLDAKSTNDEKVHRCRVTTVKPVKLPSILPCPRRLPSGRVLVKTRGSPRTLSDASSGIFQSQKSSSRHRRVSSKYAKNSVNKMLLNRRPDDGMAAPSGSEEPYSPKDGAKDLRPMKRRTYSYHMTITQTRPSIWSVSGKKCSGAAHHKISASPAAFSKCSKVKDVETKNDCNVDSKWRKNRRRRTKQYIPRSRGGKSLSAAVTLQMSAFKEIPEVADSCVSEGQLEARRRIVCFLKDACKRKGKPLEFSKQDLKSDETTQVPTTSAFSQESGAQKSMSCTLSKITSILSEKRKSGLCHRQQKQGIPRRLRESEVARDKATPFGCKPVRRRKVKTRKLRLPKTRLYGTK